MFDKTKAALIGSFSLSALLFSLFLYGLPIHVLALFKLILRAPSWQTRLTAILEKVYRSWICLIIRVYDATHPIDWDIRGIAELEPDGSARLWDFLTGRIPKIVVSIRKLALPPEFLQGDYLNDPAFKKRFQGWLNNLWQEKDEEIDKILEAEG